MFYAEAILSKKGPLAKVWLASHLERKLTKAQLLQTSIPQSVNAIVGQEHGPPLALRLSGQLLLGVSRIYARKARYLLEDCNEALIRIKLAFRPGAADITSDSVVATHTSITLPEALTEFDILLPSSSRVFGDNALEAEMAAAAMNTSRIQDITLAEQSFDVSAVARGVEAMGMGEEDLLGHDDNFKLDLDDDFVLSPGPQGDTSMLEPEMGRDAMQGLDDSMIRPEGLSLVGKDGALLLPGDISREDLNDDLGGDILRFGDDGLDISMGPDSAMVPNTQEVALQEAEAAVLAAANKDATERQAKRRRLNMSDLVTNEATSLSPDEIRGHLNDASDIVRVPTYLPSTRAPRLDALSSAAVASRFLAATSVSPFDALFENTGMDPFEQEVPSFVGGADAGIAEGEEFRMDDFDDLDFGAGMGEDLAGIAGQPDDQSILLGDKSVEQLERLEEESFLRLADEQQGDGVRLFAEDLPVRDEDLSMQATQLAALATQDHEDVLATTPGASDALGSGYSKNTIRAIHLIDSECRKANIPTADSVAESEKPLSYLNVSKGAQRSDAVKLFFELLVLKSKNFVDVKQEEPFEDILIAPRDKLRQAAESVTVASPV